MMRYKLISGVSMVIDKGTDHNLICWLIKFLENHILYFHVIHLLRLHLRHKLVNRNTVKPVLRGHSKLDKTKILMTNGNLMKVKSIAESSKGSILHYF